MNTFQWTRQLATEVRVYTCGSFPSHVMKWQDLHLGNLNCSACIHTWDLRYILPGDTRCTHGNALYSKTVLLQWPNSVVDASSLLASFLFPSLNALIALPTSKLHKRCLHSYLRLDWVVHKAYYCFEEYELSPARSHCGHSNVACGEGKSAL